MFQTLTTHFFDKLLTRAGLVTAATVKVVFTAASVCGFVFVNTVNCDT